MRRRLISTCSAEERATGSTTHTNGSARVENLTPGLHDKGVVHGDDEDLAGILEVGVGEVAGNVLLRASRAFEKGGGVLARYPIPHVGIMSVQARLGTTY